MKANNGKGNNPLRDGWETPKILFDTLNDQYDFQFDCCATAKNKKCEQYSNDFEAVENINIMSWMNPPFSIAWKMFEQFFKVVNKGVAIYRCEAGAELRSMGRLKWVHTHTGEQCKSPSPITMFILNGDSESEKDGIVGGV